MRTSEALMKKVRREILWGSAFWFLLGIGLSMAKWFGFYQPTRADGQYWAAFGFFVVICHFVADCTEVVLQKIQEGIDTCVSRAIAKE